MLTKACPEAVQLLIDTMTDEEAKPELRVQCANTIIDRVMGKAAQPIKADVYKAETPLTLDEMFTIAACVLGGVAVIAAVVGGGGSDDPPPVSR